MKTILVDAVETFVTLQNGQYQINTDIQNVLEGLPNRKIVVSNANDSQMIEFGLTALPYEVFTLKHNPEKTDPTYFETLLKHYDLTADNVVYFEHNKDAVSSAKSVGIESFYFDIKRPSIYQELRAFLQNTSQ